MRLDTEFGYGLPVSQGLTGTPYAGLGLGEADARDWRLGLRFSSERLFGLIGLFSAFVSFFADIRCA